MSETPDESSIPSASGPIVAGPGRYYRNARFLMVALSLAMAGWFAYDGFVKWPREQEDALKIIAAGGTPEVKPHGDFDIRLQRILALGLPFVGIGLLTWMLYNSRGEYRLEDNVLHIPGHPPIPLENIRQIDESRFDRKGIVYLDYDVPGSSGTARATVDDFVYDQTPTDKILAQIKAAILPAPDPEVVEPVSPAPSEDAG